MHGNNYGVFNVNHELCIRILLKRKKKIFFEIEACML
jgi:hypothetical protein